MTKPLDISTPIDEAAVRRYRLDRIRTLAEKADVSAVLLFDPINIRYANGSRNMQVWTMHNFCRYALVMTTGPSIMFELTTGMHLLEGLETIDESRPAWSADYFVTGYRSEEIARTFAEEIAALVDQHGGGNTRLAVDRLDVDTAAALNGAGLTLTDGKKILEHARAIKSLEEIRALKVSLATCEAAMHELREQVRPGMTEQEALAILLAGQHQARRRIPGDPVDDLGTANQPLVPGNGRPGNAGRRPAVIRHRPHRTDGFL